MYFKCFRKYFVYFGYLRRITGLFLYKLCCFTLRQYLRKTNDSSLAHILMKKLCCGFNLKRTMADWESLTGANPHNDFLSLYMSRTQSTPIYPHMNGHQPELAFAPSPKKESAESFASILDRDFDNFCNSENIDEAVTYLNQEFTALGFPSLYDKGNKVHDPVRLINATYELLQRTQRSLRVREELENRCHRYESDVDHLQNGQDRLKASIDSHVRELVQIQEKERQLKNKNKLLDKKLKTEKEEVKRLQSVIQHRDAQYKHELKKKERELIKLKDRMHSLIVDKSDRRLGLEMKMVNNLQRMDKARSRWAANSAKEEEELYRGIISTYEQKQQELMVENVGLRDSLNHLQEELIAMLKSNNNSQLDIFNGSKEDGENSDHEASDNEEDSDLVSAQRPEAKLASGVFQMPYDLVRPTIEQTLKDKCHKLKRYIKKVEKQRKKDEASSVCSSGLCGNGPQAASVTMSPSSAAAHQEEVERLNKQIERYRQIIEEQETMLQNQLDDQAEGESHATALLNETALWEEKDHLERDRHLFMEKQQNFELERANFTEAAIRLARERQAFEEEKASLLTQQFKNLTPFTNKTTSLTRPASASVTTKTPKRNDEEQAFEEEKASLLTQQFKNLTPITNKTTSHTRPASASVTTKTPKRSSTRNLPSIPIDPFTPSQKSHSSTPSHQMHSHTPSTSELYRHLGITRSKLNGSPPDGGAGADRQSGQVRPRPHTAHGCSPAPGSRRHASKPVVTLSPPEASRVAQHIDGVKLTLSYQEKDRGGANF